MANLGKPGGESPTTVLQDPRNRNHRILRQTICKVHLRDFSECVHLHTAQHPYWDNIKSLVKFPAPGNCGSSRRRRAIAAPFGSPAHFRLRDPPELRPGKVVVRTAEDPFKVMGPDMMRLVMVRLDARSLARSGVLSKDWKGIAHADELWEPKCASLWAGKRHIPAAALLPGLSKLAAYGISIKDSGRRFVTLDDLCTHAWEYRFKDTVPEYFLALDPSRRGEPPMQRFFHADGFQTAGPGDEVWGGHESTFRIVSDDDDDDDDRDDSGGDPRGGSGSEFRNFVRINHWPKMEVCRTDDWGWELHNHICSYRSMPDSAKGGTGPQHIPRFFRRKIRHMLLL